MVEALAGARTEARYGGPRRFPLLGDARIPAVADTEGMDATTTHIQNGGGICGTCAHPAVADFENEGYSDCCNDRIEYGEEARATVAREGR